MCKLEPEIWMQQNGYIYDYIFIYVNDLAISARDPKSFMHTFENKYKFNL